jgi:hypothetical protein
MHTRGKTVSLACGPLARSRDVWNANAQVRAHVAGLVGDAQPDSQQARKGYDPHECEFCGESLPNPGPAFLKHLDESETCKFLWLRFRPHVQKEAGGS